MVTLKIWIFVMFKKLIKVRFFIFFEYVSFLRSYLLNGVLAHTRLFARSDSLIASMMRLEWMNLLKAMGNTFAVCLSSFAESVNEGVSLTLHSVSHRLKVMGNIDWWHDWLMSDVISHHITAITSTKKIAVIFKMGIFSDALTFLGKKV